jgi:hypothetical protein
MHQNRTTPELMTRDRLLEFFNEEMGLPVGESTLDKVCAKGEGPPVEGWWGNRPLYSRDTARPWAEARIGKEPPTHLSQPRKRGRPRKSITTNAEDRGAA